MNPCYSTGTLSSLRGGGSKSDLSRFYGLLWGKANMGDRREEGQRASPSYPLLLLTAQKHCVQTSGIHQGVLIPQSTKDITSFNLSSFLFQSHRQKCNLLIVYPFLLILTVISSYIFIFLYSLVSCIE
jgi:hypothetical protein